VYFFFFSGCLGGFCGGDIITGCDWNSYIDDIVSRNVPVIAICAVIMFLSLVVGIICCFPLRKRRSSPLGVTPVPLYFFFIIAGCVLLCIANVSIVNALNSLIIGGAENQTVSDVFANASQIEQYISDSQGIPENILANLTQFAKQISDGGGIDLSYLPNITQSSQYNISSDVQSMTDNLVESINALILFENLWTYITVATILTWSILTYFYLIDNSITWRSGIALYAIIILFMICISLISYQLLSTALTDLCYDLKNPTGYMRLISEQYIDQITARICYLGKEFDMIVAGNSLLVAGMFIFTLIAFF